MLSTTRVRSTFFCAADSPSAAATTCPFLLNSPSPVLLGASPLQSFFNLFSYQAFTVSSFTIPPRADQDASFLTDPVNPKMVLAADITHPPPGKPSFTSLVGSIDTNAVRTGRIQSLTRNPCYIYARSTRAVSIPTPVYHAHYVCTRAKNHYDTQAGHDLSTAASDVVSAALSQAASGAGDEGSWVTGFQKTHEQMNSRTYFC